jgi:Tfp pilus assembly protein PilO
MKTPTSIILLLISIGLFYSFTSPMYTKVQALRANADSYKTVLSNAANITKTRDALSFEYQKVPKDEVERLLKVLPDNIDNVRLALDLDNIGARYGISIKDIAVETEGKSNTSTIVTSDSTLPYKKVTVTFSFISNYDNFKKFLADIENSLRIIDVKSLTFKSADTGLNDYKLVIDTYWLK